MYKDIKFICSGNRDRSPLAEAIAIVTDGGGMMSHAAVISREFNIPCVVGTKYATEVFKDGDLIEVNANNSVVRKIS